MDYIKLSGLINNTFTIEKIWGYKWKMFDQGTKKMVSDDKPFKGGTKVYEVDTDKGKMDLRHGQIGTLLEIASKNGVSDINNKTFSVTSNGKTGIDIRYYFDEVKPTEDEFIKSLTEDINPDDIPF